MGFRAKRPPRWFVTRDIQVLMRTFPSETVTIVRSTRTFSPGGQQRLVDVSIFRGEVLVIPVGGSVENFGLGQVENTNPRLLIPGTRDVRQGDFVTLEGRRYIVEFPPNHWAAFLVVTLQQYEQGS